MLSASIAKKYAMALSGLFLISFLVLHVTINFVSIISADAYNEASHFMGTNPIIQFVMQPILAFGTIFHLIMGMVLETKNRSSRPVKYAYSKPEENSSWMSRNMIITGIMILLFFGLHFYDFWFPELNIKYVQGDMSGLMANGEFRYFEELQEEMHNPVRVALYVLAFVFLALHLLHGFQSAFQSVGFNHRSYTPFIKKLS
ncbi:MAG: succinate dehydrogenase cytochrome b subunit, partial [Flavobacteriales bacterium]